MLTAVLDSDTTINLEDGRYMVFTQIASPDGRVLDNIITIVDIDAMTEFDNMIETIKTANNLWDGSLGYYITGIIQIKKG